MYTPDNLILNPDKAFISANIKELKSLSDSVYMIPASEEFRLDLISYSIYGRVDLKWLLMYVNDIYSIQQLKTGLVLKYPKFSALSNLVLKTIEKL